MANRFELKINGSILIRAHTLDAIPERLQENVDKLIKVVEWFNEHSIIGHNIDLSFSGNLVHDADILVPEKYIEEGEK